ncbi:MAG: catalase, partial [Desulfovibrio sp.]|nr:catalase [Desulfovibrio sp.]
YSLYNEKNQRVWVKFHLKTQQGIKNLTDQEAEAVIAKDRESSQTDLFKAIERGDFPRWTMYFQIMSEEQAGKHRDNPFDLTKVWSHKEYPLLEVGVLELNRNPENYFADVEQAAFNPANIVPGIGFSPDKMLQGRLFAYGDAQRYRLGVNHHLIPVNAPKIPVRSYHRDGLMRVDGNYGATIGYDPNSYGEWVQQDSYREPPLPLEGEVGHHDPHLNDDCFYQAGDLYRLLTEDKRRLLLDNTARNIAPVTDNIKYRHAAHCYLADKDYGGRLADLLGLKKEKVAELAAMGREERLAATSAAAWPQGK